MLDEQGQRREHVGLARTLCEVFTLHNAARSPFVARLIRLCFHDLPGRGGRGLLRRALRAAKPWQTGASAGVASPLGTSTAQDGQPKPWETGTTTTAGDAPLATAPERPWARPGETIAPTASTSAIQPYGSTSYGSGFGQYGAQQGYGSSYGMGGAYSGSAYGRPMGSAYGSTFGGGYGASTFGTTNTSPYGGYGSSYGGGGMYGGGGYTGGGMYGSSGYGAGGMYGGSSYGMGASPYGGMYGAPGGMSGGAAQMQLAGQLPGAAAPPRSKWQAFMEMTHNLMQFFGRVSFLMDENAHAVHFFITALLQLLDRASFLWGEVARFVLRLLGYKRPLWGAKGEQNPGGAPDGKAAQPALAPAGLEAAWKG